MLSINRPGSSFFLPSVVLQIFAFLVLVLMLFLFEKVLNISQSLNYLVSFISSYFILMIVIWKINDSDLLEFLIKYHKGRDFWSIIVPFIFSNLLMIFIMIIKKIR
jgi:hypothetical protein